MNTKYIITSIILSLLVIVLYVIEYTYSYTYNEANSVYQVYLDGEVLGIIESDDELYDLINEEQQEIKDTYGVDYVYPPDGLNIVKINTYNDNYLEPQEIYDKISDLDNFTVKGYEITIKYNEDYYYEEEGGAPDDVTIYVIDKSVFESAIKKYILAFVSEEEYNNYINGEIEELTDVGEILNNMYFRETITIKEAYIGVDNKIYLDATELSQDLLFGFDAEMSSYVVKLGDSIESISNEYKLNTQEFLIANPTYNSEDDLLKVGSTVNVTLIDPIITFVYSVYKIEETVVAYSKQTVVDTTKDSSYSEVTVAGVTGLTLNYEQYDVINGEQSQEIAILQSTVVREAVDEVTTVGPTYSSAVTGKYVEIPGDWGWPTNSPYVITSRYTMRWGKLHEGIDISGTGLGSPIYAIGDGTVITASVACSSCAQWSNGTYIVIEHDNNIYSLYAHLNGLNVSVGQTVKKGQIIGYMGKTGYATGVHLHLSIYIGNPSQSGSGAYSVDPLSTIYAGY